MTTKFTTNVKKIGGSFYALIPSWVLKANDLEFSDEQEITLTLEQTNG